MQTPPEWIQSERDEKAIALGYWFDERAAERVRKFFRKFLRHSKGQWAGQPFELLDWQWRDVVGPMFGWKAPDGFRRYRRCYVEIVKKSGKSTLCAGIGLYMAVGDNEPGAEVYIAASDRMQAGIIYHEAANMVKASPALSPHVLIVESQKKLSHPKSNSTLIALSADVPTKEGLNSSCTIFDELHAQKTAKLWDTLLYAGASRRQPLHISITTAGESEDSICWEQHDYALKVKAGIIEDLTYLPVIYAADKGDDWKSPATWAKANPSLGITVSEKSMEIDCKDAASAPRKARVFKRYRLNIWPEAGERWIDMAQWDACSGPVGCVDWAALKGRACFASVDLASTSDMTACGYLFPPTQTDPLWRYALDLWCPEKYARERDRKGVLPAYGPWIESGLVTATTEDWIDYEVIRKKLMERAEQVNILEVIFDPFRATEIMPWLTAQGFNVVMVRNGIVTLSPGTKELERWIVTRRFVHGGNQVLRWMASNVQITTDSNGNIKPDREDENKRWAKIDGIQCLVMCIIRGALNPDAPTSGSVYDSGGIKRL